MTSLAGLRAARAGAPHGPWRGGVAAVAALAAVCFWVGASDASAAGGVPAPAWKLLVIPFPTIPPSGTNETGQYFVVAENVGGAASGAGTALRDQVPPGVTIKSFSCEVSELEFGGEVRGSDEAVCEDPRPVLPSGFVIMQVSTSMTVAQGQVLHDSATVSGGGTSASQEAISTVGGPGARAAAGISSFNFDATGPAGEPSLQASGHPSLATISALFNDMIDTSNGAGNQPVEPVKNFALYLPLGFFGNPQTAKRCPAALINAENPEGFYLGKCPPGTRIGTVLPMIQGGIIVSSYPDPTSGRPLYNVEPEHGFAAEFAFEANKDVFAVYVNLVRRHGNYMFRVVMPAVPEAADMFGLVVTLDGDVTESGSGHTNDLGAFLTNPATCSTEPLDAELEVDTWLHPGSPITQSATGYPRLEACGPLEYDTALAVSPETPRADEPSGYTVGVKIPQAVSMFDGLATPPTRRISVTLPAGASLSPAGASGASFCQKTGPSGINIEGPESEAPGPDGLPRPAGGHCPPASTLADVRASTPLLAELLRGHLYLATPRCGGAERAPCGPHDAEDGNLFPVYLELDAPGSGAIVKLTGSALVNAGTGQITANFDDTPQFPVSDLTIETRGGPRAWLANPQRCGPAITSSLLTSWNSATAPASATSTFAVEGCAGMPSFSPGFIAGTTTPAASAYAPFTFTLRREDGEQNLGSFSLTLPPGLLAALSHVARCPQPQASEGTCPIASRVGVANVAVGSGPVPVWQSGPVYLTGPYGGTPFGLSIALSAIAGPFDFGTVIVRVGLSIDPHTAQITAVSGPVPAIVDGVPLRVRTIGVTFDAPDLTINPTSCESMRIVATATSTEGTRAPLSSPFQASGCRRLAFRPSVTASTRAQTSKRYGSRLTIKLSAKPGQANIASVSLTLPKQFPVRLTALRRACTKAQFEANPADCPADSNIGLGRALTPLLSEPLVGPAYLVSRGGSAYPDLVFVLQSEGVRVDLTGRTDIKGGLLNARFGSIPDAPISSFEAVLPQARDGLLGANLPDLARGSFCARKMRLLTTLAGHNGALIKRAIPIAVVGCVPSVAIVAHQRWHGKLRLTISTTTSGVVAVGGQGVMSARKRLLAGIHTFTLQLRHARRGTVRKIYVTLRAGQGAASAALAVLPT